MSFRTLSVRVLPLCWSLCWSLVVALLVCCWTAPPSWSATPSPADLELILQTREIALDALNNRDFDQVNPYLHPDFTITTVDNQLFQGVDDFETYWEDQFETNIETITMALDDETERVLLSDDLEVAYGEATSTIAFQNGPERVMRSRWTAVLQKDDDKWLIQSLHFSANLLDNPVLTATQSAMRWIGLGAGVSGAIVGAIVVWILKR